ncbi:MAG: PQQ-binding-like beta-propeller repeat protein, partial [Candidatus Nanoarchaeia archaeon]
TGSKAIVRNDGSSPVNEVIVFINGELFNYTLDSPIQPGELREINFNAQQAGEDLEIKLIYNRGKTVTDTSPANKNTEDSGFVQSSNPDSSLIDCLNNNISNTWFTGSLNGNNGSCCGDDGALDNFYNSTNYCCNGSFNSGSCFCGDNICQFWENSGTCTNDCVSWHLFMHDSNNSGYSNEVTKPSQPGVFEVKNFTTPGLLGNFVSVPLLADVDNDNDLEIIIRGSTGLKVFYGNNYSVMWNDSSLNSDVMIGKTLAITSPDENNDRYIITSNYDGLYALYAQNGTYKWSNPLYHLYSASWLYTPKKYINIKDVTGDGKEDIIFLYNNYFSGVVNNTIGVFNVSTGELIWKYMIENYFTKNTPAAADLDNDGIVEIIFATDYGNIYALNGNNGTVKWTYNIGGAYEIGSSPSLADLDNDGKLEIVIGASTNYIYALYSNGSLMWNYNAFSDVREGPAIGDINNDGISDIVFITINNNVTALFNNGTLMWNFIDSDVGGNSYKSYPIIGDPDGDGIKNILYSKLDDSNPTCLSIMILYGTNGTEQWSQKYLCNANFYNYPGDSLALGDIDGDGVIEIIYAADDTEEPPY